MDEEEIEREKWKEEKKNQDEAVERMKQNIDDVEIRTMNVGRTTKVREKLWMNPKKTEEKRNEINEETDDEG